MSNEDVLQFIYGIIANELPMDGRDYTVSVSEGRLSVTGITPIGKLLVEKVEERVNEALKQNEEKSKGSDSVQG